MKWISKFIPLLVLGQCSYAATLHSLPNVPHYTQTSAWFLMGQIGGQKGNTPNSTTIHNGSGLVSPYDEDIYTTNAPGMATLLGAAAGYRWEFSNRLINAVSLGVQYQHFFSSDVGGQVTEFSLPQFTNYHYTWETESNLLLANTKFTFFRHKKILPYFSVGLGAVFNNGQYSETALAGVTPRISPDYESHSAGQFAYTLGGGIDYQLTEKFFVSVGYQYSDLGNLSSGNGTETWTTQHLNFSDYQSNAFVLSIIYLFGANSTISPTR